MTWTKEDTEALRMDMVCRHCGTGRAHAEAVPHKVCEHPRFVNAASALECRAADEIERLTARVAELEAERAELGCAEADLQHVLGGIRVMRAELDRERSANAVLERLFDARNAEIERLRSGVIPTPVDVDAVLAPVREALSQLANRAASAAAEADKYRGAGATAFDLARAAVEEGERGAYAHSHCMVHNALAEAEKTGRGE